MTEPALTYSGHGVIYCCQPKPQGKTPGWQHNVGRWNPCLLLAHGYFNIFEMVSDIL